MKRILEAVAAGRLSTAGALEELRRHRPGEVSVPDAVLDVDREARSGFPEAIYAAGKTPEQTRAIFQALKKANGRALATRCPTETLAVLRKSVRGVRIDERSRTAVYLPARRPAPRGNVAVLAAGTSDLPVADEAVVTLEFAGIGVIRCTDVGVAGIHRLLGRLDTVRQADAVIVVAGMEGALPSVVGGLVAVPVIAVPTSVGYGASFGGIAALLGMLNSCAAGVTVVNIDNGFGAAVAAIRMINGRGL
ncbi:MAG TPA: nickel pincer cofactor biosynthesis protein LarB [Candidatus Ozemobacteraceae bacterium]